MNARRPNGSRPLPLHSFRSPDPIWKSAQVEAERRNETLSSAINRFLVAYGKGGDVHLIRTGSNPARPRKNP